MLMMVLHSSIVVVNKERKKDSSYAHDVAIAISVRAARRFKRAGYDSGRGGTQLSCSDPRHLAASTHGSYYRP